MSRRIGRVWSVAVANVQLIEGFSTFLVTEMRAEPAVLVRYKLETMQFAGLMIQHRGGPFAVDECLSRMVGAIDLDEVNGESAEKIFAVDNNITGRSAIVQPRFLLTFELPLLDAKTWVGARSQYAIFVETVGA